MGCRCGDIRNIEERIDCLNNAIAAVATANGHKNAMNTNNGIGIGKVHVCLSERYAQTVSSAGTGYHSGLTDVSSAVYQKIESKKAELNQERNQLRAEDEEHHEWERQEAERREAERREAEALRVQQMQIINSRRRR